MNSIGRALAQSGRKIGLLISKNAPQIFTAVGCIGVGVTAVLASKATLKVDAALEETKNDLEKLHTAKERMATDEEFAEKYPVKDYRRDLALVYFRAGKALTKIYWPAITSGILSIACILKGQNIIHGRYISSVAACDQATKLFKEYRKRVVADLGEDADRKYRFGIEDVAVVTPVLDKKGNPKTDKNGEIKTVTETVHTVDGRAVNKGDFARIFDEVSTKEWDPSAAYNKNWLLTQQSIATEMLQGRGYLFLNEVYRMLGLKITEAGQDVGWLYIKDDPDRDCYVDFRMFELNENGESHYDAMTDTNNAILLDFNCDGYIRDKLFQSQKVYD